ncbi:MAG: hypothetical protein NWF07_09695 [Candidatus Bathyarchaeota archaeon]|nr:hypothetical protein [Candidatus Bathyarchaeota archaeon]
MNLFCLIKHPNIDNKPRIIAGFLFLLILVSIPTSIVCEASEGDPNVRVTTLLRSVEKVDLAESTFNIDFILIIEADLSEVTAEDVQFEFANGEPSVRLIVEEHGENSVTFGYRVKGDFVAPFELGNYPFDSHSIQVLMDFMLANHEIILEITSIENPEMMIVGWDLEGIESRAEKVSFDGENFMSRYVLEISIRRPLLSTILKNIIPISVISAIVLLTFLISPTNPAQRIEIGVATLLSATAFHLSLLGGIPPTGEFTIADGIMLAVYLLHLYSLLVSVYLMRLMDREDMIRVESINRKAVIFLPLIIILPIVIAILINL